jgi:hypothetical protein
MPPEALLPRHITVTGEAQVIVSADQVLVTVGLEASDLKLAAAKAAGEALLQKFLAVVKQHRLDPQHLQTEYMSIEPLFKWREGSQIFAGYFVRRTVLITLADKTQLESLLTDLIEAGITQIHRVEFRTTELRRYREEARVKALQAAQAKAQTLAQVLNQKVGQPLVIQENKEGWRAVPWWGASAAGSGPSQNVSTHLNETAESADQPALPGQVTVSASLTATFELE